MKSSIGVGALLSEGIGDTIRISLTDDPVEEVRCAKEILKALELTESSGMNIVSCPTCGRTRINLIDLVREFEEKGRLAREQAKFRADALFVEIPELGRIGSELAATGVRIMQAITSGGDVQAKLAEVKALCEKLTPDQMPIISTFGEGTLRIASENHLPVKAFAPSPTAPSLAKAVDNYISAVLAGEQVDDVEFAENEQNEQFLRTQQTKLSKKSRTRKK